jgi:hypothetical protein
MQKNISILLFNALSFFFNAMVESILPLPQSIQIINRSRADVGSGLFSKTGQNQDYEKMLN